MRNSSKRSFLSFIIPGILLSILIVSGIVIRCKREEIYSLAISEISDGNYQAAIDSLSPINEYQDAQKHILYAEASILFDNEQYAEAEELFSQLEGFLDSDNYKQQCVSILETAANEQQRKQTIYDDAKVAYDAGKYITALPKFTELEDFLDSGDMAQDCRQIIQKRILSNTLSAGIRYSAGIGTDGTVYFSGVGFSGESTLKTWEDIVSISVKGRIIVGLKNDGTVVTAGEINNYRIDTSMWTDIVAVEAGQQYIVGLKEDGTLTAQGHNGDGQTDIDDWTDIISIACGWRHTVGLDSSGRVHITGYGSEKQLEEIERNASEWTKIVAISAGGGSNESGKRGHTVALRRDGTAVAVGDNSSGQCNVQGEDWTNLIAISAGDDHTVGLRADGTVVTTQNPKSSADAGMEIHDWKNVVEISAGYGFTLALVETQTDDGKTQYTVVGDGNDHDGQRDTDSWSDIVAYTEEQKLLFNEKYISTYIYLK